MCQSAEGISIVCFTDEYAISVAFSVIEVQSEDGGHN
jgi:hypothetical protein